MTVRYHAICNLCRRFHRTAAQPGNDIGMRFIDDNCIWMGCAGRFEQAEIGLYRPCTAEQNRRVIRNLPRHKNALAFREGRYLRLAKIVFCDRIIP